MKIKTFFNFGGVVSRLSGFGLTSTVQSKLMKQLNSCPIQPLKYSVMSSLHTIEA